MTASVTSSSSSGGGGAVVRGGAAAASSVASSSGSTSTTPTPGATAMSLSPPSSSGLTPSPVTKSTSVERRKQTPQDFYFGKIIGEGSFSSVFLTKEVSSGKEYAIKVCDKRQIIKEKKTEYIKSEKNILVKITDEWEEKRPFFVRIHSTFQDASRLFFVITYAKNGDLLKFIEKMAERDIDCTQFYAGELLSATEFIHERGIIHRDLKPENILLNERMHILITDFGSAKLLEDRAIRPAEPRSSSTPRERQQKMTANSNSDEDDIEDDEEPARKRASFVGTAQYVSPEILTARGSSRASDLWAIGCILYQMCTGMPPFQSQSDYLIFQKIQRLDYSFHEGFDEKAKNLIQNLLVIEPTDRIGAKDRTYYTSIRSHPFFEGLNFDTLAESTPPSISPYVPRDDDEDPCWRKDPQMEPGANRLARLQLEDASSSNEELSRKIMSTLQQHIETSSSSSQSSQQHHKRNNRNIVNLTNEERAAALEDQRKNNKYHQFVEGNLIIKQGILDKKKGLWARRRMFLLTEGPRLFYVDPDHMVLKGEIPWSKTIRPEIRDFKIFFVHTPNRVYYLIDPESGAKDWCHAVNEVRNFYYGSLDEDDDDQNVDNNKGEKAQAASSGSGGLSRATSPRN